MLTTAYVGKSVKDVHKKQKVGQGNFNLKADAANANWTDVDASQGVLDSLEGHALLAPSDPQMNGIMHMYVYINVNSINNT